MGDHPVTFQVHVDGASPAFNEVLAIRTSAKLSAQASGLARNRLMFADYGRRCTCTFGRFKKIAANHLMRWLF